MSVKMQEQWDSTHLCGSKYFGTLCGYFLQTDSDDTVINGKKLDRWCYYCTSENKVRKIGSGGSWTGLSPKFCPKRKALERKADEKPAPPTYFDVFLQRYPQFDVDRFDDFADDVCAAECFDDVEGRLGNTTGKHDTACKISCTECWRSECALQWKLTDGTEKYIDPYLKTVWKEEENMARKMEFDAAITKDMQSAASDSFLDNIKMIDINEIAPSRNNFYEITDIELLADDIEREGLKQSLVVVKDPDTGLYEVKGGHRRLAAIKLLINEKRRNSTKIPCYVDGEKSAAESQFDLIMLNATQRKYSDADVLHEYEEITRMLKQLNNEGKGLGGRMRENIAKILGISNGQVGKLDNIRNNAVPEIQSKIKSGEMSISTANEIAKLSPEKQKEVVEKKPDITSAEVKEMQEKKPVPPKITKSDFDEDFDEDIDEHESKKPLSKPISDSSGKKSCSLSNMDAEVLLKYFDHLMYYTSEEDEVVLKKIREKLESCG